MGPLLANDLSFGGQMQYSLDMLIRPNAKVSGAQHEATDRAIMAKPCPSRRGVLSVRMRSRATNGLTALLAADSCSFFSDGIHTLVHAVG